MREVQPYEHFAGLYDERSNISAKRALYSRLRETCSAHSPKVLELFCGTGNFLMAAIADGCQAVGVDRSKNMLDVFRAKLRRSHRQASLFLADVELQEFEKHQFDIIVATSFSICYLPSVEAIQNQLMNATSWLKAGGVLYADYLLRDTTIRHFRNRTVQTSNGLIRTNVRRINSAVYEVAFLFDINGNGDSVLERHQVCPVPRVLHTKGIVLEPKLDCIRDPFPEIHLGCGVHAALWRRTAA